MPRYEGFKSNQCSHPHLPTATRQPDFPSYFRPPLLPCLDSQDESCEAEPRTGSGARTRGCLHREVIQHTYARSTVWDSHPNPEAFCGGVRGGFGGVVFALSGLDQELNCLPACLVVSCCRSRLILEIPVALAPFDLRL